jgi:hypothetical protein
MNKIFKIASAAILAGAFVLPAFSAARADECNDRYQSPQGYFQRVGAMERQDEFFDSHPGIRNDLTRNPRLVDNREYRQHHPELQSYLHNHPNMRRGWQEHPRREMRHQERWESRHDRD